MKNFLGILKSTALFDNISESELNSLLSCLAAKVQMFEKKQFIFSEGEQVQAVGIVLSGQVQVIKEDFYGNKNIVSVFEPGDLFAETFVCSDAKTLPVSVVSASDSEIMFVDFKNLITTCGNSCAFHHRLILNMLRIMANKNILLNQKMEFTSKRTTREKLLAYLSAEAKKAKSASFDIPMNRQELADFLSVDRSAMSAELSKLRDEGALDFNKNHFTLSPANHE
jgi:CRP-like cAMP-binding protein